MRLIRHLVCGLPGFIAFFLGAGGIPLSQLIDELGVSKQAAGQLVDTLVLRGYLKRTPDTDDRRKLNVTLSERGRAATAAQAAAREN